ncbi:MAG TPA: VOC family protein [Kofleriaceae bacterium]
MIFNRSAPWAYLVPVLTVSDVRDAVLFYRAWGFVEHVQIGDGHRAQLGIPNTPGAELIVAEVRPGRRVPTADRSHQLMLKVRDVDAAVQAAVLLHARVDVAAADYPYGERQATVTDPFGHQWTLTQTIADTAPEAWGGVAVQPRER